jgi:hypothetical protein
MLGLLVDGLGEAGIAGGEIVRIVLAKEFVS